MEINRGAHEKQQTNHSLSYHEHVYSCHIQELFTSYLLVFTSTCIRKQHVNSGRTWSPTMSINIPVVCQFVKAITMCFHSGTQLKHVLTPLQYIALR
jgi:hypothetical protein